MIPGTAATERERLAWQLAEVERLSPSDDEWAAITAEHGRLSHAQALMTASQEGLDDISEGERNALKLVETIGAWAGTTSSDGPPAPPARHPARRRAPARARR